MPRPDDRRRGHNATGALEAVGHCMGVVEPRVPRFAHARDEKDLVVHGEPEQEREQEDRDRAFDLIEAIEVEARAPTPNTLFFTAGIDHEADGRFGEITPSG